MASMRRWWCQYGALFIGITVILPVMSSPTTSKTSSTSPIASPSATRPPLPPSCLNIKDPETHEVSAPLSDAAQKTLNDIRDKNPNIRIDGCIALWIDKQTSFNNQVWFNQKPNQALLFFDKGINPRMLEADGTCIKENPEKGTPAHNHTRELNVTFPNTPTPSVLSGRAFYMAEDPVRPTENTLLIGVPLNDNNTLAERYFVGINHIYDDDSWTASAYRESTFIIEEPGVVISGFTTWPVAYAYKGYSSSNAAWHGNYINAVMNDKNASTTRGLTLYRNQFVTMKVDPVTIIHNGSSSNPDYLYSITDNQFISCFSEVLPANSAIDFTYTHRLPEPSSEVKVKKTIQLAHNRFHGQFQRHVISIELPSLTEALVEGNQYNESRTDWDNRMQEHRSEVDRNNYVLRAYGNVCFESESHYPLVKVMNNTFNHPGVSVAAEEQIKMKLMHNQLMGDKGAITASHEPVLCSFELTFEDGSNGNTYDNQLAASPCEGLRGKQVHGGFTFTGGTPCPPEYQTTTRSNKTPKRRTTEKLTSDPLSTTVPSANSTIEASAPRLNGTNPEEKQEGLGGGVIAGIVSSSVVVTALVTGYVAWLVRKKISSNRQENPVTYHRVKNTNS